MRFHNLSRALLLIHLLLIGVLTTTGCSDQPATSKQRQKSAHLVEVTQPELREVSIDKTLTGTLQAIRSVQIFNQEEGLLTKLPYYEGDVVEQGEQIAQLEDASVRADLAKATANLKQAELDLKRLKDLIPRKLASEDEVAKARTAVDVAKAEVIQNQIRLDYTKITAPFTGTISERLV